MTDHESRLRAALEAGPIDGPWIAAGPSFGAAQPQYLNEVLVDREGDEDDAMTVARCAAGMDGGIESSATIDFIAAANPEAIRSLLDRNDRLEAENVALRKEVDALRAATSRGDSAKRLSDAPAGLGGAEAFVRNLLWDEHPECCGCPVEGAHYMGATEMICCGNPEPSLLNDLQIVASLRERFPDAPVTQGHSHGSEQDGETQ